MALRARLAAPPPAPVPEHLKKLFETKPGFANYYFNKVEQDRALKGLKSLGDFSSRTGSWKLGGVAGDGRPFEFTVAEKGIGLVIGADKQGFLQLLGPQAEAEDEPQGTGGLLMAVQHFKLLLTKGPHQPGDVALIEECLHSRDGIPIGRAVEKTGGAQ